MREVALLESKFTEQRKRVKPEVLQAAILDEIAERLYSLEQMQKEEKAEGVVEPIEPVAVTDEVRRVVAPFKPWFSVVIVNDGPDDVYAIVNSEKSFEWHQIPKGEPYKVDMKRAIIKDVLLKCESGENASVRVVGSR